METLFKTVTKETSTPIEATVTGEIPSWINGSLYRNGPGRFEYGDTKYNHWFDGSALLHRFHITNGKVTYCNRFLRSDTYCKNTEANRIVVTEFGTMSYPDPCKSLFQRIFSWFEVSPDRSDNTLINFFPIGESLYTATETNFLRKVDAATLETLDKVNLTKIVSVHGATAHPHIDQDGSYHNLGSIFGRPTKHAIVKITPAPKGSSELFEKAEIVGQVSAQWKMSPCYFHSFGMSENYYILVEQPLCINILKLFTAKFRGKAFADAMEYWDNYPVKFHILDKKTGEKVNSTYSYTADPFIVIHHLNAYEENDNLVLDLCSFKDGNVFNGYFLNAIQSPGADEYFAKLPKPRVRRYVLPLKLPADPEIGQSLVPEKVKATATLKDANTIHCQHQFIGEDHLEFPQINYKNYNTKKYRFAYGCGYLTTQMDSLIKMDVETGQSWIWKEDKAFPSEPMFVARPDGTSEDDGVLLSVILSTEEDRRPYLLVLDARDMHEVARATIDVYLCRDMHGTFLSHEDFPSQL